MGQTASTPQAGTRIQVIGAGLSRTGTASFSSALNVLLAGPVYHGGTQITMGPASEIKAWMGILRHWLKGQPQDREKCLTLMEQTLDGYAATTDAPASQLVPELMELYPDAKVIYTVRDPEAWAESHAQIRSLATMSFLRVVLLPLPGMRHFVDYINLLAKTWDRVYEGEQSTLNIYHRHIAWLKEVVPEDRLVFFDVKEGWEPLCRALGKDVPTDIPFPWVNDSKAIDQVAEYHIKRGVARWAGVFTAIAVTVAWFTMR
ncbi:NAD dependent epimerase/dehydratase [Aspergillus ambiguus]|uniref:sulfotransferase family protein n=1 Tax=Aspergillus ambiguus TaxID=176160 RepID=UPI003CCCA619